MMDGVLDIDDEEILVEDDDLEVNNSFFENRYHGVRILILAPHSDDEINIAGNMIINLANAKADIYVAYSTNSDFDLNASIRAEEAVNSLNILGVKKDHIIFLERLLRQQAKLKLILPVILLIMPSQNEANTANIPAKIIYRT